jgi:hypothetical protein
VPLDEDPRFITDMALLTEGDPSYGWIYKRMALLTKGGVVLRWPDSIPRVDTISASPGSNHSRRARNLGARLSGSAPVRYNHRSGSFSKILAEAINERSK